MTGDSLLSLDTKLFEKVMLYNCLKDSTYLEAVINYTNPSFFENDNYKSVFSYLLAYYSEYNKVPNMTELKMHIVEPEKRNILKEALISLKTVEDKYDKDALLKVTEKFLREKHVMKTLMGAAIDVQSGEIDASKILKDFEKACTVSLVENLGFDYLENIDQHCEDLLKTFERIPSKWDWLDEKLGGGFLKKGKAVYLFFGATNVGKSIFLGNIATNVLTQNKTVVLLTFEMSEEVYAKRISANLSQIPNNQLEFQIEPLKGFLNSFKAKNSDAKLIIKEFPPKSSNPLQIKAFLHKLKRKGIVPDIIVLDYLSLVKCPTAGKNSYESQQEVAEHIRALSYEFGCSIITAVQMNRTGYNQANPDLETTAESMGIAHTVDAQISIWLEEDDIDMGLIHIGIVKNRFGPRQCSTVLNIDYPTFTITNADEVDQEFSPQVKKIPGTIGDDKQKIDNEDVKNTLEIIQMLGDSDED